MTVAMALTKPMATRLSVTTATASALGWAIGDERHLPVASGSAYTKASTSWSGVPSAPRARVTPAARRTVAVTSARLTVCPASTPPRKPGPRTTSGMWTDSS